MHKNWHDNIQNLPIKISVEVFRPACVLALGPLLSVENFELKGSPVKACSRSLYSHACYAFCQECIPCSFLPSRSIHLHFFPNLSRVVPVLAVANVGSCVGLQNEIGHPARCHQRLMSVPVLGAHGIKIGSKTCLTYEYGEFSSRCFFHRFEMLARKQLWTIVDRLIYLIKHEVCCIGFCVKYFYSDLML